MDESVPWTIPGNGLGAILISPGYTGRAAMVAAMLACGHAAVARVAAGGVWEGECDIVISRDKAPAAYRASQVWTRAAEYLQGSDVAPTVRCGPAPAEPARTPRLGCRGRPPVT
jgi:hypothetical protein